MARKLIRVNYGWLRDKIEPLVFSKTSTHILPKLTENAEKVYRNPRRRKLIGNVLARLPEPVKDALYPLVGEAQRAINDEINTREDIIRVLAQLVMEKELRPGALIRYEATGSINNSELTQVYNFTNTEKYRENKKTFKSIRDPYDWVDLALDAVEFEVINTNESRLLAELKREKDGVEITSHASPEYRKRHTNRTAARPQIQKAKNALSAAEGRREAWASYWETLQQLVEEHTPEYDRPDYLTLYEMDAEERAERYPALHWPMRMNEIYFCSPEKVEENLEKARADHKYWEDTLAEMEQRFREGKAPIKVSDRYSQSYYKAA